MRVTADQTVGCWLNGMKCLGRSALVSMMETCDLQDAAGHALVAAYAVERPEGQWSLMPVNRDQLNSHAVRVVLDDAGAGQHASFQGAVTMVTFGSEQYVWHADGPNEDPDPNGLAVTSTVPGGADAVFTLPKASLTVLRGKVAGL